MRSWKGRKAHDAFRNLLANALVVIVSFVCIGLISEFIIFRFLLPAADLPRNQFMGGIIKYIPNQKGIFRKSDDYQTAFRINADGWNSRHARYIRPKSDKSRIAIIGDSYVEALMVDYRKSLAEQLEDKLGRDKFEVYRFGISGAPLSQYLQILRREVVKYSPDLVVIVLVHNDFDESYQFVPGRYTSSFLKINVKDGKILGEIQPKKYQESLVEYLVRSSAVFRYFVFNRGVNIDNVRKLIFRDKQEAHKYQANIDVTKLNQKKLNNAKVTEYLMKQIKDIALEHNFQVLFIMDGDRDDIYQGANPTYLYNKGVLSLNEMAKTIAEKYGIAFIDLQPVFQQDYQKNHIKFNSAHDSHWNEYGHKIVAETIFDYLREQKIAQGK